MKFRELEELMEERNIVALADIARVLNTSPQAVSNWKARDQVPYRVVAQLKNKNSTTQQTQTINQFTPFDVSSDKNYLLSDILLTVAKQLKVILLISFLTIFINFTYVQFIMQLKYVSWATVLISENQPGANMGGLSGIASQFGVNIPTTNEIDLSSPSLYPELLRSRTFAEIILEKEFYTKKFGKKLPLLNILTYGEGDPEFGYDTLITEAAGILNGEYLKFDKDLKRPTSKIVVTAYEPEFAKNLADTVLVELEALNRRYKEQQLSQKTIFIENRISTVTKDLKLIEVALKDFNDKNRQISSPSLQLELDRIERDLDVQKNIYLTLKQQLELAKIEEIQGASLMQILDPPQVSMYPSNKNLLVSIFLSGVFGLFLGLVAAFIRSYLHNDDFDERKKINRIKNFIFRKWKDVFYDRRISGTIGIAMFICLPFYLSYESQNPVFFNKYSLALMIFNLTYIFIIILCATLFFLSRKKVISSKNEL
tara:strand:- start:2178 stop:3629 length:1452 start_codon:yes stop_codon:yes gene_type:complete